MSTFPTFLNPPIYIHTHYIKNEQKGKQPRIILINLKIMQSRVQV